MNDIAKHMPSSLSKAPFFAVACAAVSLSLLCGCMTMQERVTADARMSADIMALREDIARVQARMEGMEAEHRRISDEQEKLKVVASKGGDQAANAARRLEQIERSLDELNAARAKDREFVINELSARMADVLAKSGTAGGAGSRTASAGAIGYEHVVQAGETLSQIAAAYKVSASSIIEVNDLKNPDMLKQGQKLFIPR